MDSFNGADMRALPNAIGGRCLPEFVVTQFGIGDSLLH
jgi:hypothetical protein